VAVSIGYVFDKSGSTDLVRDALVEDEERVGRVRHFYYVG
jgi:hypothetical protein